MDQHKQEEIDEMMHQLIEMTELSVDKQRSVVPRLKTMLVEAGDRVNRTTDRLIEQLRRFLSSRVYLENKRAGEVIELIEQMALRLRDNQPKGREFTWIDGKPAVHLPMDRAPFQPSERVHILTDAPDTGDPSEVTADGLFSQHYIDQAALKKRLQKLLRGRSQISLSEVVALHPIEKGLSELVAWLNIATTREKDQKAVIDAQQSEVIPYTKDGKEFQVKMPQTVFLA